MFTVVGMVRTGGGGGGNSADSPSSPPLPPPSLESSVFKVFFCRKVFLLYKKRLTWMFLSHTRRTNGTERREQMGFVFVSLSFFLSPSPYHPSHFLLPFPFGCGDGYFPFSLLLLVFLPLFQRRRSPDEKGPLLFCVCSAPSLRKTLTFYPARRAQRSRRGKAPFYLQHMRDLFGTISALEIL